MSLICYFAAQGGLSRVELGCANSSLAPSFTGCMRDFSMNGQLTRFEKAQALEGVTEGCNRYEVCPLITCGDKGICIDLWHKARSVFAVAVMANIAVVI